MARIISKRDLQHEEMTLRIEARAYSTLADLKDQVEAWLKLKREADVALERIDDLIAEVDAQGGKIHDRVFLIEDRILSTRIERRLDKLDEAVERVEKRVRKEEYK